MTSNLQGIKHICFDMAGTLYRETPEFNKVHDAFRYKLYAQQLGIDDSVESKRAYDQLYSRYGSNSAAFASMGLPDDFWQQNMDNLDLRTILTPDLEVSRTLGILAKSYTLSVFSNFKLHKIEELFDYLQIDKELFSWILDSDSISKRKPDPEGFHKIVELAGCQPSEILYVGDREAVDIIPAHQLGIKTALVYGKSDIADVSVPKFSDLATALQA